MLVACLASALATAPVWAGPDAFQPGSVIEAFGPIAPVENAMTIPPGTGFRVVFDAATPVEAGEMTLQLVSAARFINMNAAAGVPPEAIHVAIVVHGGAVRDMARTRPGEPDPARPGTEPANAALIAALIAHGAEIYVCGQSAAYHDVGAEDLLPGVTMALSAMTAHALLQQDGYTLNPF